jgi:hypothetical protein
LTSHRWYLCAWRDTLFKEFFRTCVKKLSKMMLTSIQILPFKWDGRLCSASQDSLKEKMSDYSRRFDMPRM